VGRPPGLHALQEFGNLAQWRPDKHDFLVSKIAMPFENYLTQAIGFNRPMALIGLDAPIPPGRHTLETESIPVDGTSRPVYRRVALRLTYQSRPGLTLTHKVDPRDWEILEAALIQDEAACLPKRDFTTL